MKIKKLICVLLSILLMLTTVVTAFAVEGKTYYIDSISGSDSNSGLSQGNAWKTTQNITYLTLNAGDKILFRAGGEYESTLQLVCSGTKDLPVVIGAYGEGARPVLTTSQATEVLRLWDCSYVTVKDLEITAHNGGGIWINTINKASEGINIENVVFHDIQNYKVNYRDTLAWGASAARACIMVKGLPAMSQYPVNDLTVQGCEMYDCGNGISLWGSYDPDGNPWEDDETTIKYNYNTGTLVKDCYFHDMDAEAVVVGICDGALVTNCRSINCCQGEGVDENGNILYYTAAMWFWGSVNSTIQYCEIAGQKNVGDGMAVDFDSFSNYCTYQYIYSHDNSRFMMNNAINHYQEGNTVRYCLSVNDNRVENTDNKISTSKCEKNFSFYNNTMVNLGPFRLDYCFDSFIANNIFIMNDNSYFKYDLIDFIKNNNTIKNNCYYGSMNPLMDLSSLNVLPGFAGDDYSNPESFILNSNSPLIGKGCAVEGQGEVDFFGNSIESNNIGCYSGKGSDEGTANSESIIGYIIRIIKQIVLSLVGLVKSAF